MSGCGETWFSKKHNAITFEPETDKDLDRLEELLEKLKEAGYENRIIKRTTRFSSFWLVTLEEPKKNE